MRNLIISGILLFSILLMAASCDNTTQTTSTGYIGGTNGLAIAYALDAPPDKVMDKDQETFSIGLDLENKGEYNIKTSEVIATVSGIDLNAFGIASDTMKNSGIINGQSRIVSGTSTKLLSGDHSYDISFNAGYKESLPADLPFNIITNVCYRYQTKAATALCLRKDVVKKGDQNDPCKVNDPLTVSNSGAPLQVISVTETASSQNKVSLVIEISNMGTGVVYQYPEALNAAQCSETGTDLKSLRDKVRVTVNFTDNKPSVSCGTFKGSNTGVVQLIGGKTQRVTCELDTSGLQDTTFTKIPNIQLDYVYKQSVTKQVIVQSVA